MDNCPTHLKYSNKSARMLENPSCHRAYEAWNAGEALSSLSTEKARNDLVGRRGKAYARCQRPEVCVLGTVLTFSRSSSSL